MKTELCQSCKHTFKGIGLLFKCREFRNPILFYVIQLFLLPNLDDMHYTFLVDYMNIEPAWFDLGNALTYTLLFVFLPLYNSFLIKVDVWKLILMSLTIFLVLTILMYINTMSAHKLGDGEENIYGTGDYIVVALVFFFGTQSTMVTAYIPTQVVLTYLVEESIEASTMAMITSTFILSYEVGAKFTTSIMCKIFQVNNEHMENY